MGNKRWLLTCSIATVLCVLLENRTTFDLAVQQLFYRHGDWMITKADHAALRWFWYTGVKWCIGFFGGTTLILALLSLKVTRLKKWRHFFCVVTLSLVLAPLIVASLKAVTGVYSPCDLLPFGGKHPHMGMLTHLWRYGFVDGGRSFPAGHASGGFALMALYYLPVKQWLRYAGLVSGIALGWCMGLYQMARGEHFLSHTLTTMFLALAVILSVNYAYEHIKASLHSGQPEQPQKS